MSARILILTAGFGEGHNAAARALAEAFEEDCPGSAVIVDIFAQASPRLNAFLRRGYITAINRTPRLWNRAYRWMDRPAFMAGAQRLLHRELRELAKVIELIKPEAVCSTFPAYASLVGQLSRAGRYKGPHFNIVTDSISVHSSWWRAGCDGWFVPNEDTAIVLRDAGLDASSLHVCGFPVTLAFANGEAEAPRPDPGEGSVPRILYIINSGSRHAEATARLLLAEPGWEVTCTVGRDDSLRRVLDPLTLNRAPRASIFGWTDQIPQLLMTHHVVVSKAGGATTQEAIAARCPMIVNQVVPGQEEGNYELLRRHQIGAFAATPEAVLAELRAAFAGRAERWYAWRAAVEPLARPSAARVIAAHVRGFTQPPARNSAQGFALQIP